MCFYFFKFQTASFRFLTKTMLLLWICNRVLRIQVNVCAIKSLASFWFITQYEKKKQKKNIFEIYLPCAQSRFVICGPFLTFLEIVIGTNHKNIKEQNTKTFFYILRKKSTIAKDLSAQILNWVPISSTLQSFSKSSMFSLIYNRF